MSDDGLNPLIKDFQDQITAMVEKFEPLIEEARQIGMTGILIIGGYDELARVPHNQWRAFGNPHAIRGQVEDWRECKNANIRELSVVVDHDEDCEG